MNSLFGPLGVGSVDFQQDTDSLVMVHINNNEFPAKIQSFQVSNSERIQPITCFNDRTHMYAFGEQPLQGNISGFCLAKDFFTLVNEYKNNYRAYMADKPTLTISNDYLLITGVATSLNYSVNSESNSLVQFSIDFMEVDSFSNNTSILK